MQGYERPKILKLPQGEERWAPRRLPVDIGDVMMKMRMNSGENKYIAEHVSKYAQGVNPYGEWGYPYKVNKQFRPPMIDPRQYEALSRMPVKFDAVTAGPIVKGLYEKKIEINKVAPKTILEMPLNTAGFTNPSVNVQRPINLNNLDLHSKIATGIPFHPSMPHLVQSQGVPEIELDPKIMVRPNMGIHFPYHVSDQSRDVVNMRTPTHVAVQAGYKDPNTIINISPEQVSGIDWHTQNISVSAVPSDNNILSIDNSSWSQRPVEFTPKVQTAAWYNPSCYIRKSGLNDTSVRTQDRISTVGQTNVSWTPQESERSNINGGNINESFNVGGFEGKGTIPRIDQHQQFNRTRSTPKIVGHEPLVGNPVNYSGTNEMASRMGRSFVRN